MDYLGNLRAPPHRSSTAVVYLYVCRASDICIFVSVHTLHLCARAGQQTRDLPQPQPALTSNQTSHFSASRDNVPSSDGIVHKHYLPLNNAQNAHVKLYFLNTYHRPFIGAVNQTPNSTIISRTLIVNFFESSTCQDVEHRT